MYRRSLMIFACLMCLLVLAVSGCDDAASDTQTQDTGATTAADTATATTEDTATAEDVATGEDTATTEDVATTEDTATATAEDTATGADTADVEEDVIAPPPPLLDTYNLLSNTAYPESVAFDPTTRAFYTGSLGDGTITRTEADGAQSQFFGGNDAGEWLMLGLEVDVQRRRLWACAALGRDLTESEVWVFDIDSGERLWQQSLEGVHPSAVCSDVDLNADGTAYASDRSSGNIYLMDPEAKTIEIWTSNPLLDAEIIGQNGIARSSDGRYLLIVKFLPARLMRVGIANPNDVSEVALLGVTSPFTSGADAVTLLGDAAYVVTNSEMVRVTPENANWLAGQAVVHDYKRADGQSLDGFSGVVVAEGGLYASKSEVLRFAVGLPPRLPFLLHRVAPTVFDAP